MSYTKAYSDNVDVYPYSDFCAIGCYSSSNPIFYRLALGHHAVYSTSVKYVPAEKYLKVFMNIATIVTRGSLTVVDVEPGLVTLAASPYLTKRINITCYGYTEPMVNVLLDPFFGKGHEYKMVEQPELEQEPKLEPVLVDALFKQAFVKTVLNTTLGYWRDAALVYK